MEAVAIVFFLTGISGWTCAAWSAFGWRREQRLRFQAEDKYRDLFVKVYREAFKD